MSYIVRNTIILGSVLLIIVGFGGYFTVVSLPNEVERLEKIISTNTKLTQQGPVLLDSLNTLTNKYEEMNNRWLSRTKEVPPRDITGQTYEYIIQTVAKCGEIKLLDVSYGGQKDVEKGKYGYGMYSLVGVTNFDNIFKFVWHLENGRRLMKIDQLTLTGNEVRDSMGTKVDIRFDMKLHSYFSPLKELNIAPNPVPYELPVLTTNPFYPWLLSELRMIRAGEIDIRSSFLKGVVAGQAFIIDQNGRFRTLEEDDAVYLGFVSRIVPEEGKIVCILDEGGIRKPFELFVRSEQAIKQD